MNFISSRGRSPDLYFLSKLFPSVPQINPSLCNSRTGKRCAQSIASSVQNLFSKFFLANWSKRLCSGPEMFQSSFADVSSNSSSSHIFSIEKDSTSERREQPRRKSSSSCDKSIRLIALRTAGLKTSLDFICHVCSIQILDYGSRALNLMTQISESDPKRTGGPQQSKPELTNQ